MGSRGEVTDRGMLAPDLLPHPPQTSWVKKGLNPALGLATFCVRRKTATFGTCKLLARVRVYEYWWPPKSNSGGNGGVVKTLCKLSILNVNIPKSKVWCNRLCSGNSGQNLPKKHLKFIFQFVWHFLLKKVYSFFSTLDLVRWTNLWRRPD